MNKQEWRDLFEYNSQKVLNNQKAWQKRYEDINAAMEIKQNNLRKHLN